LEFEFECGIGIGIGIGFVGIAIKIKIKIKIKNLENGPCRPRQEGCCCRIYAKCNVAGLRTGDVHGLVTAMHREAFLAYLNFFQREGQQIRMAKKEKED